MLYVPPQLMFMICSPKFGKYSSYFEIKQDLSKVGFPSTNSLTTPRGLPLPAPLASPNPCVFVCMSVSREANIVMHCPGYAAFPEVGMVAAGPKSRGGLWL